MLRSTKRQHKVGNTFRKIFTHATLLFAAPIVFSLLASTPSMSIAETAIGLQTNQAWIESLQQGAAVRIENTQDAFDLVFSRQAEVKR